MFDQFTAIIRNTFFESIRQPIVLVILLVATLMVVLGGSWAAFTMEDDQHMLINLGMSTVFVSGALLAGFVATGVLAREIENKTALTVVSKPVPRPIFVLGKYFGVAGAMLICSLYLTFVFLLVERHGVLQTVRDPLHGPVIVFGVGAIVIALIASVWCNYFYNRVFASTMICFAAPLVAAAYLLSLMFQHDFQTVPLDASVTPAVLNIWKAMFTMMTAILVMTAIAIAASARLGQVMTIVVTMGVFMLGLLSDWLFGRPLAKLRETWLNRAILEGQTHTVESVTEIALVNGETRTSTTSTDVLNDGVALSSFTEGAEPLLSGLYQVASSIVPNFQRLWLSDAVTQEHTIPASYVTGATTYGLIYVVVALAAAVFLFQPREVG